ncbi:MAG TPA: hypothetical protein VMT58_05815 [Candidatus Binataceae bacterium]|nr:hypothetical protein [Candidatus Binataceae bacterium]
MNNFTVVTKLRLASGIAGAILLVAGFVIAGGLYFLGQAPRMMYDNDFAAAREAQGMEDALYKIEWGRIQPDSAQIILGQERSFAQSIEAATARPVTKAQAQQLQKIGAVAAPIINQVRTAQPGDESADAKIRDLLATVADLMTANDAATSAFAARAESQAKEMIAVTIIAGVLVPWVCFVAIWIIGGNLFAELKEMRRQLDELAEGAPEAADKLRAIDKNLSQLGFPKRNPMLAD